MRVLHTSDWHIGHQFHNRKRDDEFAAFLNWILNTVKERKIDALIVAGDVFDSSAPPNSAVRLYYEFLRELQETPCRAAVITGGNHDSPSFLNAPRELLRAAFPIYIFGSASPEPEEEVIALRKESGEPELIIGAVPYLRDADLVSLVFGENLADHEKKVIAGLRNHYRRVAEKAEELRAGRDIPVVLTGHFFLTGGRTVPNDGMREYIGGIGAFDAALLPETPDYYALGHIHQPQKIGADHIRYSGSPLKMCFSDAAPRTVCEIEFTGRTPHIAELPVPQFSDIRRLCGNWEELEPRLEAVAASEKEILCEVTANDLSGAELVSRTDALFQKRMKNYPLILRSAKAEVRTAKAITPEEVAEMTESQIFELRLKRENLPDADANALRDLYRQAVLAVKEENA